MEEIIIRAAQVTPTARQLAWQQMEFYAFAHFGVNTFTNREWGLGNEDPAIFNPTEFNADQWVGVCKSAGMTGLILTCKHHDGFCLWPSRYTEHSVKGSPWREGRGDMVREVSDACRRGGIKFGVYLSPWDRHEKTYGDSPAYNRYFINQLTELLTEYGPVFCVWLDGACGEGPNGLRQKYDWDGIYATVRKLQPDAVISVCGPDVRWCGNEAGHCRKNEWSVVPRHMKDNERIQDKSQKVDDGAFSRRIESGDEDLGSREVIAKAGELVWYPAEVNTSIRPGWFYHPEEDGAVKTLEELLHVYYSSVGGNATFLLNLPPDRRGLIHENDTARLKEVGSALGSAFAYDLAAGTIADASEWDGGHLPQNVLDGSADTYWCPREGTEQAQLTIRFGKSVGFDKVVLMEHIQSGQRIEEFVLEYDDEGEWKECFRGSVVGYKRICRFDRVQSAAIRVKITKSRWCPTLAYIGVF